MNSAIITLIILLLSLSIKAQNVLISEDKEATPAGDAILDVQSTSKGILIPRLTMAQKNNITNPSSGLLIYQIDNEPGFYFYNGSSWSPINSNLITGNETVFENWDKNAEDDFTGNYDDLNNNGNCSESQYSNNGDKINTFKNVGLGTSNPTERLDVTGNIQISGNYLYSTPKINYYHVGCSEFSARNGWSLHGGQDYGHLSGLPDRAIATLHLPDGARINEIRVFYVDTSPNNMTVYLRRTSSNGVSIQDIGQITSTENDSPSRPIARQMEFNPDIIINNSLYRYTIIFESEQKDNNHRLYNIRIRYVIDTL